MKKIGVLLAGCGVKDGSEIHEAVATLLAIDRQGAQAVCIAPNSELDEVDHLQGESTGKKRNVLVESARIARGNIRDLASVQASDIDALIIPGGYGSSKNLSDFAFKGGKAQAQVGVARLIHEMVEAKKPIGAICISPGTLAAVVGNTLHPTLTIGTDASTAQAIEQLGARHQECSVKEFVVDEKNKIVSTPAYMLATRISEVFEGIEKVVREVIRLV